jgi:hypothetical protein
MDVLMLLMVVLTVMRLMLLMVVLTVMCLAVY